MNETFTEKFLETNEIEKFFFSFCTKNKIPPSFFTSSLILDTYYNKSKFKLGIINYKNEDYLFFTKLHRKEYRFLFKEPTPKLVELINKKHNLDYIASAFVLGKDFKHTESDIIFCEEEVVLNLKNLLSEKNSVYKDYVKSAKKNKNLKVEKYNYSLHIDDLLKFIEKWKSTRSDDQNKYANTTNDLIFLSTFGADEKVKGVIIKDGENIIAYNLYTLNDLNNKECISAFSKVLRGYDNLGLILKIECIKSMLENSFEKVNIGDINNDFKKRLATHGEIIKLYAKKLYKNENFDLKMSEKEWLSYTDF